MGENLWVPVALVGDVENGSATGVRVFGRELVVWRDEVGAAHVWEDRCPHRGMRLSFGFVRGDRIACLYHGWQFDGGGRCRYIPAHPQLDVPETITVTRYASAEAAGLVWVFDGEGAPPAPPPGGNAETVPVRSLMVDAPAEAVIATLLDSAPPLGPDGTWERSGLFFTARAGMAKAFVAVQPVSSAETMMHLSVDPTESARRREVSSWAEALRRGLDAMAGIAA
jgi:nitrite reductase/ring-hydroxylating ferredoxin subunit